MERTLYSLPYRLDNLVRFLLWFNGEVEGVILDDQARVVSFNDLGTLRTWAHRQGWEVYIDDQAILHDLDIIDRWTRQPASDTVDCVAMLNAWNLFVDIRVSIEQCDTMRDIEEHNDIYEKLFIGNNLPAITPVGCHYVPTWSEDELERLARHLAVRLLGELSLNAWPALQTLSLDGWLLRFSEGYTRRSNSVLPLYAGFEDDNLIERIEHCERLYARRRQNVVFKMTDASQPADLDTVLAQHGYSREAETSVQTLSLAAFSSPTLVEPQVVLQSQMSEEWLAVYIGMATVCIIYVRASP